MMRVISLIFLCATYLLISCQFLYSQNRNNDYNRILYYNRFDFVNFKPSYKVRNKSKSFFKVLYSKDTLKMMSVDYIFFKRKTQNIIELELGSMTHYWYLMNINDTLAIVQTWDKIINFQSIDSNYYQNIDGNILQLMIVDTNLFPLKFISFNNNIDEDFIYNTKCNYIAKKIKNKYVDVQFEIYNQHYYYKVLLSIKEKELYTFLLRISISSIPDLLITSKSNGVNLTDDEFFMKSVKKYVVIERVNGKLIEYKYK